MSPTPGVWRQQRTHSDPQQIAGVGMGMGTRLASSRGNCSHSPWAGTKGSPQPGMTPHFPMSLRICSLLSRLPVGPWGEARSLLAALWKEHGGAGWAQAGQSMMGQSAHTSPSHLPAPPPHVVPAWHGALVSQHGAFPAWIPALASANSPSLRGLGTTTFTQTFPGDGEGCWHPCPEEPRAPSSAIDLRDWDVPPCWL